MVFFWAATIVRHLLPDFIHKPFVKHFETFPIASALQLQTASSRKIDWFRNSLVCLQNKPFKGSVHANCREKWQKQNTFPRFYADTSCLLSLFCPEFWKPWLWDLCLHHSSIKVHGISFVALTEMKNIIKMEPKTVTAWLNRGIFISFSVWVVIIRWCAYRILQKGCYTLQNLLAIKTLI